MSSLPPFDAISPARQRMQLDRFRVAIDTREGLEEVLAEAEPKPGAVEVIGRLDDVDIDRLKRLFEQQRAAEQKSEKLDRFRVAIDTRKGLEEVLARTEPKQDETEPVGKLDTADVERLRKLLEQQISAEQKSKEFDRFRVAIDTREGLEQVLARAESKSDGAEPIGKLGAADIDRLKKLLEQQLAAERKRAELESAIEHNKKKVWVAGICGAAPFAAIMLFVYSYLNTKANDLGKKTQGFEDSLNQQIQVVTQKESKISELAAEVDSSKKTIETLRVDLERVTAQNDWFIWTDQEFNKGGKKPGPPSLLWFTRFKTVNDYNAKLNEPTFREDVRQRLEFIRRNFVNVSNCELFRVVKEGTTAPHNLDALNLQAAKVYYPDKARNLGDLPQDFEVPGAASLEPGSVILGLRWPLKKQ